MFDRNSPLCYFWLGGFFMSREDLKVVFIIAFLYIIMELAGITCPIRYITGISCAGCGMSRAWLALLRGDFNLALYYHPLVLLPIPALIWILVRRKLPKKVYHVGIVFICLLFIFVYILRMLKGDSDIVVFAPESGFIGRIIIYIKNII